MNHIINNNYNGNFNYNETSNNNLAEGKHFHYY